ncbi:energy transducer TonB [Robiginitomaculum antarcticum]|uniref:energy transducer TonB n=1 Tax=Robiginitomaculum antarcticum TaxID=437507 RepID=UPI00039DACD2|nr:energy transducer TonB [Robiginitomaculum antarcticum]
MSKTDEIKPPRGMAGFRSDGSVMRYAFTLAITTAIALAIIAFMYLLEQRTGETATRLDIPQRTAAQVYADSDIVPVPALRLRALRNFIRAYPGSSEAGRAQSDIDALEQNEEQDFAALTEQYYDLRLTPLQKEQTLSLYTAQWGYDGRYAQKLAAMHEKLGLIQIETQNDETVQPPITPLLSGQTDDSADMTAASPAAESAYRSSGNLAGGQRPGLIVHNQPLRVHNVSIIEAKVRRDATPRYPRNAQSRGVEAVVTISMDIDSEGRVQEARVIKPASGRYSREFSRAATSAARRMRFQPKQIDGEPVPTIGYTRTYRFKIED